MPSRMPEFNIEGPVIATVTPFKSDSLRVDDEALIKYLQVSEWPLVTAADSFCSHLQPGEIKAAMLSVQYLWEHGVQNIIVNG